MSLDCIFLGSVLPSFRLLDLDTHFPRTRPPSPRSSASRLIHPTCTDSDCLILLGFSILARFPISTSFVGITPLQPDSTHLGPSITWSPFILPSLPRIIILCPTEPSGSDDGFDSGDRGSFFFFFQQETDSDGLASILWQDVVPNCISYFEGQGTYKRIRCRGEGAGCNADLLHCV
jgi:hypothetical protein